MELKVWVEGIQRVVCGITEQTTVQEVVIALAQATGRTGRYTLVEKWRDTEKLLPPSEHPVKVLQKWGEYASDVRFLLKRTGASSVSSDAENTKGPERNIYRQSLPLLAKNKEKAELLQGLKRKEPKRKSLTITGGNSQQLLDENEKGSRLNSNGNNNRPGEGVCTRFEQSSTGSAPSNARKATQRFSAGHSNEDQNGSSSKVGKSKDKTKSKQKQEKKWRDEQKPTKSALMPNMQKHGGGFAAEALFPTESKNAVAAKSPTRKSATNHSKNGDSKAGKVALMPRTTNELSQNRNLSRSAERPVQPSLYSATAGGHDDDTRGLSSGCFSPIPFSSPDGNKSTDSPYRYGNSLPRSKKKVWSESDSKPSANEKRQSRNVAKKTALIPSTHRQRAMTPNPQIHREAFRTSTTTVGYSPMSPISVSSNGSEPSKPRDNFTKLVTEQQNHIEEQRDTVAALDREIKSILDKMQQRERDLDSEIAKLEGENRTLEVQCEREYSVTEELFAEDSKVASTQREMDSLQDEINVSTAEITAYKRKMEDLSKAVSEEEQLQRAKQQRMAEANRNAAAKSRKDVDHVNWTLGSMEEEIKRIEKEISLRDGDIDEKYSMLDVLNRELRQVNLQQFIRKTGSKVTVLPPDTESSRESNSPRSIQKPNRHPNIGRSRTPNPTPSSQRGNAEGVWV